MHTNNIFSKCSIFNNTFRQQRYSLLCFMNRDEGILVVLSYVVILFYSALKFQSIEKIYLILKVLMLSSVIICTIGILQYLGFDLFTSKLGKTIISKGINNSSIENLKDENNKHIFSIYSTLGNPDNVVSYLSIVFSVAFIFYIMKQGVSKVIYGLLNLLVFATLLGCGSRASLIALIIDLIIILLFLKNQILKNKMYYITVKNITYKIY